MKIRCPQCGQVGRLPEGSATPATVRCPECNHRFDPSAAPAPEADPDFNETITSKTTYCPRCGQQNLENNYRCTQCSLVLHDERPHVIVTDDNTMGGLIPYKNAKALWSYYLSIFSLIPCIGIPLGIAAVTFGIGGLKYEKAHPEVKGGIHCWVGIVLGGLCATLYTLLIAVPIIIALTMKR